MRARRWAAALVLLAGTAYGQDVAYDYRGGGIRAYTEEHWRHWTYQNSLVQGLSTRMDSTGLFDFSDAGVKPRYWPAVRNAVLNRREFSYQEKVTGDGSDTPGNIQARSSSTLADNVGDGDISTYWQPGDEDYSSDGMRNWQITINLGRVMWADSIVVVCPPLESGGQIAVPLIAEQTAVLADLPPETQAAVRAFARGTAMDSVVAATSVVGAAGDTVVRQGQVVIRAGQQLPSDLATLWALNQLGVGTVALRSSQDPGDVPKLFVVEIGDGRRSGDSSSRDYRNFTIGRAARRGNQRRFSFPVQSLEPVGKTDWNQDGVPDLTGGFVHFVRFSVYESDLGQLEFVGENDAGRAVYQALSKERRGDRYFFRVTQGNFLKPVEESVYNALPAAEQGPVRYYKRELPRISEIEVWTPGDNIARRPDERAGMAYEDGQGAVFAPNAVDGVYLTRWLSDPYHPGMSTNGGSTGQIFGTVWLDLGATFWVNRLYSGTLTTTDTSDEGAPLGYQFFASDGTALRPMDVRKPADYYQLEYGLSWTDIVSAEHQDNYDYRIRIMGEKFPLRKIHFVQFRHYDYRDLNRGVYGAGGNFSEVQLYGEGYPAEVSVTSPPVVLQQGVDVSQAGAAQQRKIMSEITWAADAVVHRIDSATGQHVEEVESLDRHPEVQVQIQTRTSDVVDSLITYYEITGFGTAAEKQVETDQTSYAANKALWDEFEAWNSMPESRTITLKPHQTRRDDDSDGRMDEDQVDGVDNDGDLLVDEDGLTGEVGGPLAANPTRTAITIKKHANKTDDDGDGSQDEDIIDGKDNDGDGLIDEDGKKKVAPKAKDTIVVSPIFAGWSAWSPPYSPTEGQNRARVTSPSPRRFLQVRANIVSSDPNVTGRLSRIGVDLAPPITMDVGAELAVRTPEGVARGPADLTAVDTDYQTPVDIPPMESRPFSYFVRAAGPDPNDAAVAQGFDQVLLVTPFAARLTGVRVGVVTLTSDTSATSALVTKKAVRTTFDGYFAPGTDGVLRDSAGNRLTVEPRGDSILVTFPASLNRTSADLRNRLIELQFDSNVLRDGAQVAAYVRRTGATFWQLAEMEAQDATELVDSQSSVPRLKQTASALGQVTMASVITPNGDGVNDRLVIQVSLLYLREDRPLELRIYDLAGRLVHAEDVSQAGSGVTTLRWDGHNDATGEMVTPGIYACQVNLKSDKGDLRTVRLVSVAY